MTDSTKTVDDIIKECIKAYKQEDPEDTRLLILCEKLQLIKLTEISVELDKRFEDYLVTESLSVKDLNPETMGRVLVRYLRKNNEAEREFTKWMDSGNNFEEAYTTLNIISEYISGMLERIELGREFIPDEVFERWTTYQK